jgi:site-specific recombinase XerD
MPEETPAAAKELLLTATTHWLRHSFATDAVRRGVSLVALQKTLGHKDPKTTSLYTTTDEEELYQQVVSPRK